MGIAPLQALNAWLLASLLLGTEPGGALAEPSGPPSESTHWAYTPPERAKLPEVENLDWPRNPIDYFVLSRLEAEGLEPAPEAEPATLIRRLSLDLIGLPPSVAEVERFVDDPSLTAYRGLIERLLASPRYGERWARPWLDMARYADSQGYEKDGLREIWPYRDWVIEAFNNKVPFDQFTIEQIAGDMLPNATRSQKIATGFHRNTMTNTEGGTDDEEFRVAAVVDRVNTTMEVWMATTFGCAQCHDHKYDPITQEEYFQMFAFFNQTADEDRPDEEPVLRLPTPDQKQRLQELDRAIRQKEEAFNRNSPELQEARARWQAKQEELVTAWNPIRPVEMASAGAATLTLQEDGSVLASGPNPDNDTYTITADIDSDRITGIRLEVIPDESLPHEATGRGENGAFILTRIDVEAIPNDGAQGGGRPIRFAKATADQAHEGFPIENTLDDDPETGWAIGGPDEIIRSRQSAYFFTEEPIKLEEGATLKVNLAHESVSPQANIGRFRLHMTDVDDPRPLPPDLPQSIRQVLAQPADRRSEEAEARLDRHFRSVTPLLEEVRKELAQLRQEQREVDESVVTTPIMQELPEGRDTHIHVSGNFLNPGRDVEPAVPEVLHDLPEDEPANRLTLARWLVDEDNPLTARVMVNRLWEKIFGDGLVPGSQDFGTRSEPPTHPKLLDWLATEFMRRDWRIEEMLTLIVDSATYRQSSRTTPALQEIDPYNRLLARGPRLRLEAELIRDFALKAGGLLTDKLGGPSAMPPQPDGIWNVVYSGDQWETSRGEDRYRRGVYTFWRRTSPYPSMVTFDAPSREICVMKRSRSNTPLQALTLLNDPVYVEAAQGLARRMLSEAGPAIEDRIDYGFRLCVSRTPTSAERDRLIDLYKKERRHYEAHPDAAREMATNPLGSPDKSHHLSSLAAMTVVANVLLNLDEAMTKG